MGPGVYLRDWEYAILLGLLANEKAATKKMDGYQMQLIHLNAKLVRARSKRNAKT